MALTQTQIEQLYVSYFGRPADFQGVQFYISNNSTADQVAATFAASAESQALFGGLSTPQLIAAIYQNLFNRQPEVAGLTYWTGIINSGLANAASVALAIGNGAQGTDQAAIANKVTVANSFTTALSTSTANIVGYSGASAAASARAFLATVDGTAATLTTAQAGVTAAVANAVSVGGAAGSTFSMTTLVDTLTGTSGNDTFIGDNSGSATAASAGQVGAADSINGGAGTDTLKIFLNAANTSLTLPTLTSVEVLYLNGGILPTFTAPTGITTLMIDSPVASTTSAYTLGTGQDIVLNNVVDGATTVHTIAQSASATSTAQQVTLNNVTSTAGANTIDLSSAKITTLNLIGQTAASKISLTNTGAAITTMNITALAGVTVTEDAATATAIKTINASASTAAVSVNTAAGVKAATFAFTGGSGNDTLTLKAADLSLLTAGSQLDGGAGTDKLVLSDAAFTASDYTKLSAIKNFETLGFVGAAVFDASQVTGIKAYSIDAAVTASISNIAAGSTTTLTVTGATLTLAPAVGVSSTAIVLGSATSAGLAETLTLTGLTAVSIASNGTAANSLGTLVNSANTALTITGAAALSFTLATSATTGSKVDASAFTGKLTVTGSGAGDVLIGGSAADTFNVKGSSTVTTGAGADTVSVGAATVGAGLSASFVSTTVTDLAKGDNITFGATATFQTTKVDVTAATTIAAALDIAASGTTTNVVKWFQFGGNTYVVDDTSANTVLATGDQVVQLTGAVDLSTSTISGAALTFS